MDTRLPTNQDSERLPVCSICIANYNGIGVIDDCINSVLDQDVDFEYEIIVHDDASSDDSVTHIRDRYPEVRLIISQENVGFCVSNNRLVAEARGQYILLLNNDAALFPDALKTLHAYALAQKGPVILGLPQYDAETGRLLDIGSLSDFFLNPIPNVDIVHNDVAMISGACLWIPADLWREIEGFPAWFHTLAEDMYLCRVARLWGYPIRAIPISGFRHWVGKTLGGGKVASKQRLVTSTRRRRLSERNKSYVIVLTYPTPVFQIVFPLHLLLLFVEGVLLFLVKRDIRLWQQIYLPCFQALWRQRISLLALRRKLQAKREASVLTFFKAFTLLPHKFRMLLRHGLPEVR